jgi:hypothetical protein
MTGKPVFWYGLQVSTILLYVVLIAGGYALQIPALGWGLFGAIFLLHVFELKTALAVGREKGLSIRRIVLKNLVFGFTWWLPLKKGILVK